MTGSITPYLHEWLLDHADREPAAAAIAADGLHVSYGALASRVIALAARLRADGSGRGDRVLIAAPESIGSVTAMLAVNAAGATVVHAPSGAPPATLIEIAHRSHAAAAFLSPRQLAVVRAQRPELAPRAWLLGPASQDGDDGPRLGLDGVLDPLHAGAPGIGPDRPGRHQAAVILFTSGSTGTPLGVVQTHANLDANSRSIVRYLALSSADRALLILPLHYCYGRSVLQTHLLAGGSVVLESRAAFPRTVLQTLSTERCTGFAGVPMTFEIMRRLVDPTTIDLPSLRYLTQAGGAMDLETIGWTRSAFAPARLFIMYGQTEATARLTYLPPDRAIDKEGSIGIPIPDVEVRVVDDEGREVPPGIPGNLVARGENVTPGYLDDPAATADILRDGWLWTGDFAVRDTDGFLFHKGRAKEILKIGGHRVSPAEIEEVLLRHADVAEAVVVGRADPVQGEVPEAFVALETGAAGTPEELLRWCQASLPAWMVPATITLLDRLPRSEAGKVLRARLRDDEVARWSRRSS